MLSSRNDVLECKDLMKEFIKIGINDSVSLGRQHKQKSLVSYKHYFSEAGRVGLLNQNAVSILFRLCHPQFLHRTICTAR